MKKNMITKADNVFPEIEWDRKELMEKDEYPDELELSKEDFEKGELLIH